MQGILIRPLFRAYGNRLQSLELSGALLKVMRVPNFCFLVTLYCFQIEGNFLVAGKGKTLTPFETIDICPLS